MRSAFKSAFAISWWRGVTLSKSEAAEMIMGVESEEDQIGQRDQQEADG